MKHTLATFAVMLGITICSISCGKSSPSQPENTATIDSLRIHVALGVPTDSDSSDDYMIYRTQYVVSYNHNRNVCNWVAWNLNAAWYGEAERYSGQFMSDPLLPEAWYHVKHSDYTNSGYDRGHQVRSEERTRTDSDNLTTFYLTNILPQTPDLNQGVWLNMEYWCQNLCQSSNKELYIVSGGVFHSGTKIGNGVEVPDSCWKIVVVLGRGQGLKDVNENTLVYAVMIPNIAGVRNDTWDKYKTTVDALEASTGYDFLRDVPVSIQSKIESRICSFTSDVPQPLKKRRK